MRIIERAAVNPVERFSAKQLADEWDEPLGNVSYHVRALHERGLLERAGHRMARGAVQRYYRASQGLVR